MEIIEYFNRVQDDVKFTYERPTGDTTITLAGRPLNAHEEDIYNAALIQLKKKVRRG
jgi:hypothetical protein